MGLAAAGFTVAIIALYWLICAETMQYERHRIDQNLINDMHGLERGAPDQMARIVDTLFSAELHRETFAALFTQGRAPLAGALRDFPAALPVDGVVHRVDVTLPALHGVQNETVRAVAAQLPDGRIVVLGRSSDGLIQLRVIVWRTLLLGLIPGVLLALFGGMVASLRAMGRVAALNDAITRIMAGDLHKRLPTHDDALGQLARSVNRMLDEISRLIEEVQGVGDDIAHDLRTPLTRVRSRLEGGRGRAATLADLSAVVEKAIEDLDQTFSLITALLRIGQIESGARREGFRQVSLAAIVHEASDLYQPMAELKSLRLEMRVDDTGMVLGDRDLLFEAVANVLDNAVKFTPAGGLIRISLLDRPSGPVIRVQDSGPGVPPAERDAVTKRFYRADRSRHVQGSGLGLSIVCAVLRLHGFRLAMNEVEGLFAVDIVCRYALPSVQEAA